MACEELLQCCNLYDYTNTSLIYYLCMYQNFVVQLELLELWKNLAKPGGKTVIALFHCLDIEKLYLNLLDSEIQSWKPSNYHNESTQSFLKDHSQVWSKLFIGAGFDDILSSLPKVQSIVLQD